VLGFCTIITKNYLPQARALAESLALWHPEARLHVLLVDEAEGYFDPKLEQFATTSLGELPLPGRRELCFQYGLVELCTAVKPAWLRFLFESTSVTRLFYLDPDILVYGRFDEARAVLDGVNLLLTPYITSPYEDDRVPNERNLLLSGTFNLGFLGLSRTDETFRFLRWWEEKLQSGCRNDPARGYFVDQRWMDLAPCLFDGVRLWKDPGYNVGHWNLHYRRLERKNGDLVVNGRPLVFFHFSGFRPLLPERLSVHQDRFTLEDIGEAKAVHEEYAKKLIHHGYRSCYLWPYGHGTFFNGEPIPSALRDRYLKMGRQREAFGDPFETQTQNSLFNWWKAQEPTKEEHSSETKERLMTMACRHVEQLNQL
jgi:hypothetical protein